MKKIITFLLMTLSFQISATDSWNAWFEQGMENSHKGKYEEAYQLFDKCVQNRAEKDFFYYDSLLQKNIVAAALGYETEAKKGCEHILKNCPFDQIKYGASTLKSTFFTTQDLKQKVAANFEALELYNKIHFTNMDEETVMGYIADPFVFSMKELCCFLIHTRQVYNSKDVRQIDLHHYLYKKSCLCGCEKSKNLFLSHCDVCGKELFPVDIEKDCEGIKNIEEMLKEQGIDPIQLKEEIEKKNEEKKLLGKKIQLSPYLIASIYSQQQPSMPMKAALTVCEGGCEAAQLCAISVCNHQFSTPFRQAACIEFSRHLLKTCFDCCKSKDDMIKCTAPFSNIVFKVKAMFEEAGNGLAINWMCTKCGYYNENSWPPFVCRQCWRCKNLP